MIETGVIHGRFQVLHNDHLRYLLAGMALCRHLVVGITNPDPARTRHDPADPQRSLPLANPLTYFERYILVTRVLLAADLDPREFSVVPFPINLPDLYRYYVPLYGTFFLTIYDAWGEKKKAMLESLGLAVRVLWRRPPEEKGISGRDLRSRMAAGGEWEDLVPASTVKLLRDWDIPARLRDLAANQARRNGEG